MGENLNQGFYSILRWRRDVTRDEARNLAVILVNREGSYGGIKAAPLSTVAPRLHHQGLLDSVIVGLQDRFSQEEKPQLQWVEEVRHSLDRSLYLTEPQPVSVPDPDAVLGALYRAYVAPSSGGSAQLTKGKVLDRVVDVIRAKGLKAKRGQYIDDFIFDVVINGDRGSALSVVDVLSFASTKKDFIPDERDAGHFLYAVGRVGAHPLAIVQPPPAAAPDAARKAHSRVVRWFDHAHVPILAPADAARVTELVPPVS